MNTLYVADNKVLFENHDGKLFDMPNLTALYKLHQQTEQLEIKQRIQDILQKPFGKMLVIEIMCDMTCDKTLERIQTGEISKTLHHVGTYNIILESELDQVKAKYDGDFEKVCFAPFPYGMVVEEANFPDYQNANCKNSILN